MFIRYFTILTIWLGLLTNVFAQVQLNTDRETAMYEVGETMIFQLTSNTSGEATYTIAYDRLTTPLKSETINVEAGQTINIPFQTAEPGMILCTATLNGAQVKAGAAISPYMIQPLEEEPSDFDAFWSIAKNELAGVPIDPQTTLYTESQYSKTYRINLASVNNRRVYGYLTVPNASGPFPAVLGLPSFGDSPNLVQPDATIAEYLGALSMQISIHNAEPDQVDPNAYSPNVITDPNSIYYKLSLLACIRAVDYLFSRSDFDGVNMAVNGVSQGGGLAIMLAGIDHRVSLLIQSNAALCEHAGLKYNKASGFPYYLQNSEETDGSPNHGEQTLAAAKYFDAVYFAKRYTGPSLNFISYEDDICPPATVFAAFNQLGGEKTLMHARELAHIHPNEYWNGRFDFYRKYFGAAINPTFPWASTTKGYYIDAGDDSYIASTETANLQGQLEFDNATINLPLQWQKVQGNGAAYFIDETALGTGVNFSQAGEYTIRLQADDYALLSTDAKYYTLIDELKVLVGYEEDILIFNAVKDGIYAHIDWATNTGYKNERFEIERSSDNSNFSTIIEIENIDNSNNLVAYDTLDFAPETGVNFYRLKQIYTDNTFSYSESIKVEFEEDPTEGESEEEEENPNEEEPIAEIILYPNPVKEELKLNLRAYEGKQGTFKIYDILGRPIYTKELEAIGIAPISIDVSGLYGLYSIEFSIKGFKRFTQKIIVF